MPVLPRGLQLIECPLALRLLPEDPVVQFVGEGSVESLHLLGWLAEDALIVLDLRERPHMLLEFGERVVELRVQH